ncbi:MAG: rod shape-determining protein MreC [Methylococcales bacterium]|nr:rod shape-determining protein MreC [Methylococcales bacterium]
MNPNDSRQRPWQRLFSILMGIGLLLMLLDNSGRLGSTFDFIRDPLTPLLSFSSNQGDAIAAARQGPANLEEADQIIANLAQRLEQLETQSQSISELTAENERLRALLNLSATTPQIEMITADVIGAGPNTFFQDVILNKGREAGFTVGMPVITPQGLVGQIFRLTGNSTQVVLITDGLSSVPARLSQSRATGIIQGGDPGGFLVLNWIPLEAEITIGELVVSSGLIDESYEGVVTNRFPEGIAIGRIVEVERGEAALFQRAIVQPIVNVNALEDVQVITNFTPVDISIFEIEIK